MLLPVISGENMKILLLVIFCGLLSGCTATQKPSAKAGQASPDTTKVKVTQDSKNVSASRRVATQGVFCGDKDIDDNF